MITLSGAGLGVGAVSGVGANLKTQSGRPQLDEGLLERLLRRRMEGLEPLEIVLLTEDAALALLIPLPLGARLIGVVAEQPYPSRTPLEGIAIVSGVGALRGLVPEGTLVVVEPERGRALLDPAARELARLQSDTRPRVLLDGDSVPARTLSGRLVSVWGEAHSLPSAAEAMAAGADGLLYLGPLDEERADRLVVLVGGGDLTLVACDFLTAAMAVRLAARASLRIVISAIESATTFPPAWEEALDEALESGTRAALPRLSLLTTAPSGALGGLEEVILERLWIPDDLLLCPPLYLRLMGSGAELPDLAPAVAAGFCGICVAPEHVAAVKDAIRELA